MLLLSDIKAIENIPDNVIRDDIYQLHSDDDRIPDLSALRGCKSLHTLNLDYCGSLLTISGLPRSLRELRITGCKIYDIFALSGCNSLHKLDLAFCHCLRNISGLPGSLRELFLRHCTELKDISGLPGSLDTLHLHGFTELSDLSALTNKCGSLRRLMLCNCTELIDISALDKCTSLKTLTIQGCARISRTNPSLVERDGLDTLIC